MLAVARGLGGPPVGDDPAAVFDLGSAKMELDRGGRVRSIHFADGVTWPACPLPAFSLRIDGQDRNPVSVERNRAALAVSFEGGASAELSVREGPGTLVLEFHAIRATGPVEVLRCFSLAAPEGARTSRTFNAAWAAGKAVAVMAGEVNVQAFIERRGPAAILAARTARRHGL